MGIDNSFFSIAKDHLPTQRHLTVSSDTAIMDALLAPRVAAYMAAATANRTRTAYQSDLRMFLASGGSIPASPESIAKYLVNHADTLSPVTLCRRLIAVGRAHSSMGLPNPCRADLVKATMRGIYRIHGRPQRQVRPALRDDILSMLAHMKGTRGLRDRALILLGFAGAFRRSELVALSYHDLAFVPQGVTITVRRSKTDQTGKGRNIAVPYGRSRACPVTALVAWLDHAAIRSGPLFRNVNKAGAIGAEALSDQSVAALVKEYAAKAGLDPTCYSGHSLRAGLITSAARAGVASWKIRQTSGHRSDAMLTRYIRDAGQFDGNAAGAIL